MTEIDTKVVHFVESCFISNNYCYEQLIEVLEPYRDRAINDVYSLKRQLSIPFNLEFQCFELLKDAKSNQLSGKELILLIKVAVKMYINTRRKEPNISPVWTGPNYQDSPIIHKTYDTVKGLFQTAKSEILIVGYSFSLDNDYIQTLFEELKAAARRGCRIDIIYNNDKHNYNRIIDNWPDDLFLPHLYYWKGNAEGTWSSLHSKLVLVDQTTLLITSANFTLHGFKKNIETGVLIENSPTVPLVWNQFRSLLQNEEMVKM